MACTCWYLDGSRSCIGLQGAEPGNLEGHGVLPFYGHP